MRKSKMGWNLNRHFNGGKRLKQCLALILMFALVFTTWGPDLSVFASYNDSGLSGDYVELTSGGQFGICTGSTLDEGYYESIDTAHFTVQGTYADTVNYTAKLYINNDSTDVTDIATGELSDTVSGSVDLAAGTSGRQEVAIDFTDGKYVAAGENFSIVVTVTFSTNENLIFLGYEGSDGVVSDDAGSLVGGENLLSVDTTATTAEPNDTEVSLTTEKTALSVGETTKLTAALSPKYLRTINYTSSDSNVVSVSESTGSPVVTAVSSGTATVTATVGSSTATQTYYVLDAALDGTSYDYTGSAIEPGVTVTCGSTTLTSGTDYTVTYADNIEAGTATVTVTGASGTKYADYSETLNFSISALSISGNISVSAATIDTSTATVSAATITYTNPSDSSDTTTLTYGTDYTVTATQTGSSSSGITYSLTVTGAGGYTGTDTLSYTVAPSTDSLVDISTMYDATLATTSYSYTKAAIQPDPSTVSFYYKDTNTAAALTYAGAGTSTDVVYSYGTNTDVGTGTITFTGVEEQGYTGSITLTFNIVENDISTTALSNSTDTGHVTFYITDADGNVTAYDSSKQENYVHTGDAINPTITATVYNGTTTVDLTQDTDFSVAYTNATDIGQATVTVSGIGGFGGTYNLYFNIIGDLENDAKVYFQDGSYVTPTDGAATSAYSEVYDGDAHTDMVNYVQLGNTKLSVTSAGSTADGYYLTYSDNTNAGTGTITMNGTGIYDGMTTTVTFTITARPLSSSTDSIVFTTTSATFTGSEVTLTAGTDFDVQAALSSATATLAETTDYTVAYSDNVNAGTATMTVTGTGNYSGTLTGTFTIAQLDINNTTVTYTDSWAYTGSAITLTDLVISYGDITIDSSNYTVAYSNNTDVASSTSSNAPTATITGTGNLTGTYTATFTISAKSLSSATITVGAKATTAYNDNSAVRSTSYSVSYTGSSKKPAIVVKDGTTTLKKGTHYTVSYTNNTNAGSALDDTSTLNTSAPCVKITGVGNYAGSTVLVYFTITPKAIDADNVSVTDNIVADAANNPTKDDSGLYVPSTSEMEVTDTGVIYISDESEQILTKGTDYTIACTEGGSTAGVDNTLTITGMGNYTGTRTVSYTIGQDISGATATLIKPADGTTYTATTSAGLIDISYLGSSTRPGVSVVCGSDELASYDYTTATQTTNGVTLTFDATSGSTSNDGSYTAGSTVYMTATADTSGLAYYGTVTVGYYIEQLSIEDATVALTSDGTAAGYSAASSDSDNKTFLIDYTGSDVIPDGTTFTVTSSMGDTLTYGTDYTMTCSSSSAINAGDYTITLKGITSYSGTLSLTLTVEKADLTSSYTSIPESALTDGTLATQVAAAASSKRFVFTQPEEVIYTGSAVSFDIYAWDTVIADSTQDAGYHLLKTAADSLTWSTDTSGTSAFTTVTTPGTYDTYLVAKSDSNYTGYIPITVVVSQRTISENSITLNPSTIPDQTYDGTAKTPLDSYSVIYTNPDDSTDTGTLTAGTDYTVSYTDNTNPGVATATITAASDYYTGSYSTTFNIYGDLTTDKYTKTFSPSSDAKYLLDDNGALTNFKSLITNKISVTDYNGNALTAGTDYTITIEDAYGNTATSASDTGLKAGEATVYITGVSDKYLTGTVTLGTITLTGDLSEASITLSKTVYYYTGDYITVSPSVKLNGVTLTKGTDYYIVYGDSSTDGVIDVGTYDITIVAADDSDSFEGQVTLENAFSVKYNLSAATVTLSQTSFVYDGVDHGADSGLVSVSVKIGEKELVVDSDYVLSWPSSDYTSVGTKTVTVTTSDATTYSVGSKSVTFTIGSADITDSSASVSISGTSFTYTGSQIQPTVTAKYGTTTLTQGTDYTVAYANNTAVADASATTAPTVTVTGTGNYTGTVTLTFSITKAQISDSTFVTSTIADSVDFAGVGNAVLPDYSFVNVSTGSALVEGTDYTVSTPTSTTNFAAGDDVATVVFTGTGNYSGSISWTYTISPIDLSTSATVSIDESSTEYTGAEITPTITVTVPINGADSDYTLVENTDYTVSYSGTIKEAGSYTITITGDGNNFVNSRSITFTVSQRSLVSTNTAITATVADQDYTGAAVTLDGDDITVLDTGVDGYSEANPYKLVLGTDYTITSYSNNTNSGEAGSENGPTVTITGKGNYASSRVLEFNIGDSLSGAVVTPNTTEYTYDGTEKKPDVTVTLDGVTLSADDYVVSYDDDTIHRTWDSDTATSDGTKTVTITGSGKGYYGTATGTYTIEPKKNVSSSSIVIKFKDNTSNADPYTLGYTGSALEPEVEVYDTDISTTEPLETYDYEVTYSNNVEATTSDNLAYAIVTLQNDYNTTDSTVYTQSFAISAQEISEDAGYTLSVIDDDEDGLNDSRFRWTGSAITPNVLLTDADGNTIPATETVTASDGTTTTVTNYTVTYTGVSNDDTATPINAGAAVATITGANNYSGTMTVDYVIYSSLSTANDGTGETTITIPEQFYYGSTGEEKPTPTPTVVSGGNTLESGTNFTTAYTYNDDMTEGYALITPIADGTNNYYTGSYTYTFAISTNTDNLVISGLEDTYLYDGEAHNPFATGDATIETPSGAEFSYVYDDITFERLDEDGTTYTSTDDFTNAGTIRATIPITIGSDTVDVTATYTISPKNLSASDITVSLLEKDYYNGRALTPYPSVFYDTDTEDDTNEPLELTRGTDYTLAYTNNQDPGQATVVITGTGNYTNSRTEYFSIVPAQPASLTGTAASSSSIKLSWRADKRVDGYIIYAVNGTAYTQVGTTTSNTYTVTGLDSSTTYTFGVASYVTVDSSKSYSDIKSIEATTTVSTPSGSAVSNSSKKVTITLGGKSGESIKIYRASSKNGTYTQIATIPASNGTYVDSGLTSGKTYYYKLQAYRKIDGTWYGSSLSSAFSVTVK